MTRRRHSTSQPDQSARQVMSLGEAVERLARYVIVRHLALELDAVCAVSGHGPPSFESPAHRSIAAVQPVHPEGRTPQCVQMPAKIARSAPRPPFGLPELTVAVRTSLLSCGKAGKTRVFTPVGES